MLYKSNQADTNMPQPKKTLGSPNMVRFDSPTKADLEAVARANGLSVSAVVRLAVSQQLPALKAGRASLKPSR